MSDYEIDRESVEDFTIDQSAKAEPIIETSGAEISEPEVEPADSSENENYRKQESLAELGAGEGRKPSFGGDQTNGADTVVERGDVPSTESDFSELEQLIQKDNAVREQGLAQVRAELATYLNNPEEKPT